MYQRLRHWEAVSRDILDRSPHSIQQNAEKKILRRKALFFCLETLSSFYGSNPTLRRGGRKEEERSNRKMQPNKSSPPRDLFVLSSNPRWGKSLSGSLLFFFCFRPPLSPSPDLCQEKNKTPPAETPTFSGPVYIKRERGKTYWRHLPFKEKLSLGVLRDSWRPQMRLFGVSIYLYFFLSFLSWNYGKRREVVV